MAAYNSVYEQKIYDSMLDLLEEREQLTKEARKKINPTSSFRDDLQIDSLDMFELSYLLEDRFKVRIPDEKINECATVDDMVRLLSNRKAEVK